MKDPATRVKGAWILFGASVLAGIYCTVWIASGGFERVLMAISWGAIAITALDVVATTDVRANEGEDSDE